MAKHGVRVLASECERNDGPFTCPACQTEVILHKGTVKTHHFAHKPPVTCDFGAGESEQHRLAKLEIFQHLFAANVPCVLEHVLDGVRPDVFFVHNHPCAVELQRSQLTVEQLSIRTERYHALNVAVLWLPFFTLPLENALYTPKLWEKWLHTAYLGRVYYWEQGLTLRPFHFGSYIYEANVRGQTEDGITLSGQYEKRSRPFKSLFAGKPLNLLTDLQPKTLPAFNQSRVTVPERRILLDRYGPFW